MIMPGTTADRPLAFIDLETSGTDPLMHAILEVAVVRVDPRTFELLDTYESKVRPPLDAVFDARAVAINGYTPEAWAGAPSALSVLPALATRIEGCLVAGHNVQFDWAFLRVAFRRHEVLLPSVDHHLLDTASLAWPLVRRGQVSSLSLRALCAHFRVPNDGAHRALGDALRSLAVFRHLLRVAR
jgi:DNA polymerase-3 subunit epsilon